MTIEVDWLECPLIGAATTEGGVCMILLSEAALEGGEDVEKGVVAHRGVIGPVVTEAGMATCTGGGGDRQRPRQGRTGPMTNFGDPHGSKG
jgi:hypothetical protein